MCFKKQSYQQLSNFFDSTTIIIYHQYLQYELKIKNNHCSMVYKNKKIKLKINNITTNIIYLSNPTYKMEINLLNKTCNIRNAKQLHVYESFRIIL